MDPLPLLEGREMVLNASAGGLGVGVGGDEVRTVVCGGAPL